MAFKRFWASCLQTVTNSETKPCFIAADRRPWIPTYGENDRIQRTVYKRFQKIRTTTINNEPWFVGKDIAQVLGYTNSRKAIGDHVDTEDKGVTKCDTPSGTQEMTIINESGLYSLILSSKLSKKAKGVAEKEAAPSETAS